MVPITPIRKTRCMFYFMFPRQGDAQGPSHFGQGVRGLGFRAKLGSAEVEALERLTGHLCRAIGDFCIF